jgi:hypothetical protein
VLDNSLGVAGSVFWALSDNQKAVRDIPQPAGRIARNAKRF